MAELYVSSGCFHVKHTLLHGKVSLYPIDLHVGWRYLLTYIRCTRTPRRDYPNEFEERKATEPSFSEPCGRAQEICHPSGALEARATHYDTYLTLQTTETADESNPCI